MSGDCCLVWPAWSPPAEQNPPPPRPTNLQFFDGLEECCMHRLFGWVATVFAPSGGMVGHEKAQLLFFRISREEQRIFVGLSPVSIEKSTFPKASFPSQL